MHTTSRESSVIGSEDDDSNYRTICVPAIVSLLLGLAAPLTLFAPLIAVIPLAGIAVGVFALRRIATSDGALVGRAAAVTGLALSIASMSAAFTRTTLKESLLSHQAREVALEWLTLLQSGDVEKSFELTSASRQVAPKSPPGSPAAAEPQAPPLETFRADPIVHFLVDHSKGVPIEYVRDIAIDPASGNNARVRQLFSIGAPAGDDAAPVTNVQVIMQRVRGYNGAPSEWLVASYVSDDIAATSDGHDHGPGHIH